MDETQLILLKKKIKSIKVYKGQGTQLISLYLPPDADRSSVTKQLTDEISQSSNIKSAQTRKNVQAALRRITNYLKQIDFKLPQNGLILFSGDVATNPSKSDVTLIDIIPPKRLTTKLYWCDSSFHIAPLEEMAETDEIYGIIAVDKREATIALLRGKSKEIVGHETSGVPGKTRAGGQCLKDALIQLSDGNILDIKDIYKTNVVSADLKNYNLKSSNIIKKWTVKKNKTYKIITKYPRLEIQSSEDHTFFVNTEDGIIEKLAKDLKENDYLIMPEKIDIKGKLQKIESKRFTDIFSTNQIPVEILTSKNNVVAKFLKIYFDKTATISEYKKFITIKTYNIDLIKKLQLLFLRFSIISSFIEYKDSFGLKIDEKLSLELFKKHIGFKSLIKSKQLNQIIKLSKNKYRNTTNNSILPVKINKIEIIKEKSDMIDISVKNKNFIANGLIVHNSAHRFERLREKAAESFYKRVGVKMNAAYVGIDKLKGIVIGGPGHTKNEFIEQGDIDHRIKNKILGTVDTTYTDESGIKEILDKSTDILKEVGIVKERKLVEKFVAEVAKGNLATYGYKAVEEVLNLGQVDSILISEGLDWSVLIFKCLSSGKKFVKVVKNKDEVSSIESKFESSSPECDNQKAELIEEVDLFDYFVDVGQTTSTKVELISTETPEGKQFLDTFGGIGALLRYK